MMKRVWVVAVGLVFMGSSLFMMTSCAKKQTVSEQPVTPATPVVEEEMRQKPTPVEPMMKGDDQEARERRMREEAVRELRMEIRAFEASNIYFDFDRSELQAPARAILDRKATWLKDNPDFRLRIEGHCDERGTNEYNLALGERRANAAYKYLNALGISSSRMTIVSYGEERPASLGHTESAWEKNRRDEFKLLR